MLKQTFTQMSQISIRIAFGSNSFVDLDNVHVVPLQSATKIIDAYGSGMRATGDGQAEGWVLLSTGARVRLNRNGWRKLIDLTSASKDPVS